MSPETVKLYHEWRYAGARFAAPYKTEQNVINTISPPRINRAVKTIMEALEIWSMMNKTQSYERLTRIVTDAVHLDLKMQQQKAHLRLSGTKDKPTHQLCMFDPETMEVRVGKALPSRPMLLLVAPMLLKSGNSQGQDYRTTTVLEKAQVDTEIATSKKTYFGFG
jgi:hypothetical protein